ncbi:MAG: substrate-binding domain-containing protein [Lentisphaeria bacterium]|nr:substrate-binding domain-containing protein [Lentisphaeria bacterium]
MKKKNAKNIKSVLLSLDWYEPRLHTGLLKYAQDHDWVLHADPHSVLSMGNIGVDGIVILGGEHVLEKWLAEHDCPFVLLFRKDLAFDIPTVCFDEKKMGSMAANFFHNRGFKNYAAFYPHPTGLNWIFQDRLDGFCEAVTRHGGKLSVGLREKELEDLSIQKEGEAKIEFYKSHLAGLPRPLGVFLLQDSDATFFQLACRQLGLSIPEDVAIISVNNDPMICPYTPVPLSSIDPGWEKAGYLAGTLLDRLMKGESVSSEAQIIPPVGVVERLSSSILAVDDPRVANAVSFIWQNLEEDPSVDEICDAVGVSQRVLSGAFRKQLGRTIKQEVQMARIRKIKSLLLESDIPIFKIANQLNFSSEYYLYNFFKKYTGMTCKEYRNQGR